MTGRSDRDIAAVLFDKDGTLFDFAVTWNAWATALLLRLAKGDDEQATLLGAVIGFDFALGRFLPDSLVIAGAPDEIVAVLHPAVPGMLREDLLVVLNEEASLAPMAEVVPLGPYLDRLKRNGLLPWGGHQ